MKKEYPTTWQDYRIPGGEEFAVAVCGYSGRVRHLTIDHDVMRQTCIRYNIVEDGKCGSGTHCMALECPLNHTEHEHLMHMLDMWTDEPADKESVKQLGKTTVVDCLVEMARRISEARPPLIDERIMINTVEASQKNNMNTLMANRLSSVSTNASAANNCAHGVIPARRPKIKGERAPENMKQ